LALDVGDDQQLSQRISQSEMERSGSGRTVSGVAFVAVDRAPSAPRIPLAEPEPSAVSPAPPNEAPSLVRRLLPGMVLIMLSIALTVAAATSGSALSLGPIRGTWIAVVLLACGAGVIIYRLIQQQRE
jgi:hypothetical protein